LRDVHTTPNTAHVLSENETVTAFDALRDECPRATDKSQRPLRVCLMVDNLAKAGVETQVLQLIRHFDRRVVEPTLCLLNGRTRESQALEPTDCPVVRLGVRSFYHPTMPLKALRFARYLARNKIDVLHPHFADSLYFGTPIAKLAAVPSVVWLRVDMGFWMKPRDRFLCRLYNRWIDGTIVNCRACGEAVIEQECTLPDRIAVIPNGLDLSQYAQLPERKTALQGDRVRTVGVIANLRHVKGLDVFVRAAAMIAARHAQVHFWIAGEGPMRGELEALICELGLVERITLLGQVDDIPTFLSGLDVAVLSSRSEGSPNAIMEYMAAGLPIVATDVGGIRELISDGEQGRLVPVEDPVALAHATCELLDDARLATRLGLHARRRAFAEYSVETQARSYEQFYVRCYRASRTKQANERPTTLAPQGRAGLR
jgi:glycosyltransferase involved in cell wall biosynthesis